MQVEPSNRMDRRSGCSPAGRVRFAETRPVGDRSDSIQAAVRAAFESGTPLAIEGGGSKRFYGRRPAGEPLAVGEHRGILNHEPSELVLTVRAGTPVREVQAGLAEQGQWLPFDPPRHDESSTIGGVVACAMSGPTRPWVGAVRDFVLGTRIVNGRGDVLSFGGEVMKNVAGYDVSRLMAGALGTLGVLLEVSFKLLPRPAVDRTRVFEMNAGEAIRRLTECSRSPLPILGAFHDGARLHLRLAGAEPAVEEAEERLGGEAGDGAVWSDLRDHRLAFFAAEGPPLWRLSVPTHAPPLDLPDPVLVDWGGAQRWVRSDAPEPVLRAAAATVDGHASCYRGGDRERPFHPLDEGIALLHARLKAAFDPGRILNPDRLYADL